MQSDTLPVIITIIGVGVGLAGLTFTISLVFFRLLNQRINESEARMTRLISESEIRVTTLVTESEVRVTALVTESEARLSQRIDALGQRVDALDSRITTLGQEVAEVKGTVGVIRDALPLRIGE